MAEGEWNIWRYLKKENQKDGQRKKPKEESRATYWDLISHTVLVLAH